MRASEEQLSAAGRRAVQTFNWPAVEQCANEILKHSPNNPEGYFLKGLFEKSMSRPQKSIAAFEHVLTLDPGRYDAAIELANQYSVAQLNAKAAEILQAYESMLENSPRYLDLAGTIYSDIGMPDRAWPLYQRACTLQPNIELFQSNMASCAVYLGKTGEAKKIYQNLLKKNPNHQRNHYHLSRLEKAKDSSHIDQMKASLARTNLPSGRNIFINYALGKELEDLRQWDEAFSHYGRAGDAAAKAANYDVNSDIQIIDKIIETCDAEWLNNEKHSRILSSDEYPKPIFIVGLPRTGTTLTERILASHSKVESVGETQFLPMAIRKISRVQTIEQITTDIIEQAAEAGAHDIYREYFKALNYRDVKKPFFIEKLPYNFLFLGFIAKAFPEARIIHLRRNPVDACFSMYKQVFTWAYKFSYRLEDLGNYYVAYYRLLAHWKKILGSRIVEIAYEDLIADQNSQTKGLLSALDLKFEEACLEFHKNPSASTTASSVQVREKIYSHSVQKWKHFETHLKPLINILENAGIDIN